jgi:hypothetical protein
LNIPWYIPYNKVGPPDFTKSAGPMEYSNYTREGEREREGRGRERERERERGLGVSVLTCSTADL